MKPFVLLIAVLLPFIGGTMSYFLRAQKEKYKNFFLMTVVIITTALTWACIILRPEGKLTLFSLTDTLDVSLRLDGLGSLFAGLVSLLWPLALLYSFEYMEHEQHKNMFYMFYILTYGTTLGIAMSANLLTMYFFYEILTLVTIPLVIQPMTKKAMRAGRKYMYFSFSGSAFAFIGLALLIVESNSTDFVYGGIIDGTITELNLLGYFLTFLGFGVKAAVFPLHIWLPSAAVAPTPVTALLHAVAVVKSGAFAIIRITFFSYGASYLSGTWVQSACLVLVVFTIFYGSTIALRERHFKRRLAYSTVSNLSYILFGVLLMSEDGLTAALVHMVFHAIIKICAFFCAGNVIHSTGREYVFQLDGIGRKMPFTFTAFTVSALSLTGIPLFCGFVSKWMLCASAIANKGLIPFIGFIVLIISALLTSIYMLTVVLRAYFSKGDENILSVKEVGWKMTVPICIFAVFMFLFGIFPDPIINIASAIAAGTF